MVRHGEAEPHGVRPDAERRLTARGEAQSRAAGQALASIGASFEALYCSPRIRALDTARLVAHALHCEPIPHDELGAAFGPGEAAGLLAAHESVCIVGHEPDLSALAHHYCGARIEMKKGGIAALRIRAGGGELAVLLRPREIATIAGDEL